VGGSGRRGKKLGGERKGGWEERALGKVGKLLFFEEAETSMPSGKRESYWPVNSEWSQWQEVGKKGEKS